MNEINKYVGNPTQHSDMFLTEKADDVILFICEKGVAYTVEIARETGVNVEEVNKILGMFKRNNFIDKLYPLMDVSQPQFKGRLAELQAMGITSYGEVRNYSWWTLTRIGFDYIKAKFSGQGKLIKGSLITALGLQKEQEEQDPISQNLISKEEKEVLGGI